MAALANNAKELKKCLAAQPRGNRAKAMLNANQVGNETNTNATATGGYTADDAAAVE